MKLPRHIAAVMAVLVLTGMSYSASATEINVSSDKAEEGTRVTFDEFLKIAAVNSSILTTELIKKL